MAGENHDYYRGKEGEARRENEIAFCSKQIGNSSEYWLENEFIDKETGSSADPWYLRTLQRINNIESDIKNINSGSIGSSVYYKNLDKSLNEMTKDKSLNSAIKNQLSKELERHIENLRLTMTLVKTENPDVLDKIRNHIQEIKKICQRQPTNLPDDYSDNHTHAEILTMIRKERSKRMNRAANLAVQSSPEKLGMWKVGGLHISDIRELDEKIDYNLMESLNS